MARRKAPRRMIPAFEVDAAREVKSDHHHVEYDPSPPRAQRALAWQLRDEARGEYASHEPDERGWWELVEREVWDCRLELLRVLYLHDSSTYHGAHGGTRQACGGKGCKSEHVAPREGEEQLAAK
eukprot:7043643-Prymnesium_polylepis.2